MDFLADYLPENSGTYYYFFAAAFVLLALYANDCFRGLNSSIVQLCSYNNYGYDDYNGPAVWYEKYEAACGDKQSPINLVTAGAILVPCETAPPLTFSILYEQSPTEIKLYNSGHNVVLYVTWRGGKKPTIKGGPLKGKYEFANFRFRWGPTDDEGSEHMVDGKGYSMELQAAFINTEYEQCDMVSAASRGALLMISYLFLATPVDNPFLEPLVSALQCIRYPLSCVKLEPFPLALIAPSFPKNYFTYMGSLTFPPCTEGVRWIVQAEPLLISYRQIRKFRKLCSNNYGFMVNNVRPVQMANERDVFYYD